MNITDIEIFLTIANTKSISKTANTLFLSQPTVSHRLKLLEEELNCFLVTRSKGIKRIELTQAGVDFIPIAERMLLLWKQTRALQEPQTRSVVSIGCTDSANVALLSPFYQEFVAIHENQEGNLDIELNIQTHYSSELYGVLDAHDIDIGLVYYPLYYKNIACEQVFQEKLYLVQSSNPAVKQPLVDAQDLDPGHELFLKWDDAYQIWHDQWFSPAAKPRMIVDTIIVLSQLWSDEEQLWMIAPESVVQFFHKQHAIYVSELKNSPPLRCCYKIKHRFPLLESSKALNYFEQRLLDYFHNLHFDIPVGEIWGKN